MEKLTGIVERITFHSEETGWSVLRVKPLSRPGEQVTVTVHQTKVFAGATADFEGEWNTHPKYGEQFKAHKMMEVKPASASALEKYLGSGLIYGVGPKTAKKIVKHFGQQTLEVFEDDLQRLTEVPGIAKGKLEMIRTSWNEHKEVRNVMMFLQEYGVSTLFATKIYKHYGNEAIEIVRTNPYQLARDIYGIGFFSADKIALALGFKTDSPQRIGAAVKHVLASSREAGHCYLFTDQIRQEVSQLLKQNFDELVLEQLNQLEQENELKVRLIEQELEDKRQEVKAYYSKSLYFDEQYVAQKVSQLLDRSLTVDQQRVKRWLEQFSEQQSFPLSEQQAESVAGIVEQPFSILTGGPGCGKTTTTKALVRLLKAMKKQVTLAAPTGRAAQRMSEVIGQQATTIHRLLVFDPSQGQFKKNEEEPLETDFLIIDESSMLDISLTASLLKAVPLHAQVLLIGDVDQLPSVGAGNVLKDMIESKSVPCFALTQVFRQAGESLIISYAHQINAGKVPKIDSPVHRPSVWKEKTDCLFIDSDEANQEQLNFIRKVNKVMKNVVDEDKIAFVKEAPNEYETKYKSIGKDYFAQEISSQEVEEWKAKGSKAYVFNIPKRFLETDLTTLMQSQSQAEALKQVMGTIHPWSSLHYGFTASEMVLRLYTKTLQKQLEGKEVQILSPMTRGSLGTRNLNMLIQHHFNPSTPQKPTLMIGDRKFRAGDRVIQKRNNYDLEVFNGDIGKVTEVDNEDMMLVVEYEQNGVKRWVEYNKEVLVELDLAYAITIHKSQGSEFEAVIIPLMTQHFNMLYRNLVYTALTRAKKMAVFVGSRKALALSVRNVDNRARQTYLKALLQQ